MRRETLKTTAHEPRATTTVKTEMKPEAMERKEQTAIMTGERDLFTMLRDLEKMMEGTFRRPMMGFDWPLFRHLVPELKQVGEFAPAVDMYEEGNELVVKAELPGINKERVKVNLVENTLTITGEKATEDKVERKDYLRLERTHGTFTRTLTLPEGLEVDNVHAVFTDGVLEIRIPRRLEHRTVRNITVE